MGNIRVFSKCEDPKFQENPTSLQTPHQTWVDSNNIFLQAVFIARRNRYTNIYDSFRETFLNDKSWPSGQGDGLLLISWQRPKHMKTGKGK